MLAIEYPHLVKKNDVMFIKGTRFKVIEIAECYLAYGWSPDEIHRNYRFLSKSQICSAMTYYYDNQDEIHRIISEEQEEVERLRSESRQITKAELLARIKK